MQNKIKLIFFTLLLTFFIASCNQVSTPSLEREVKTLFNENAKKEGSYVRAKSVNLIKIDNNTYRGQITLTADGEEENFDINVITDGRSFQYEIPELID